MAHFRRPHRNTPFSVIYWPEIVNPNISAQAFRLFVLLCFVSKSDTGESWYGIETIAKKLKANRRSVQRWMSELEDARMIVRHKRAGTWLIEILAPDTEATDTPVTQTEVSTPLDKSVYPPRQKCLPEPEEGNQKKEPEDISSDPPSEVAAELRGLSLYEADGKLCSRWRELLQAWAIAYPRGEDWIL